MTEAGGRGGGGLCAARGAGVAACGVPGEDGRAVRARRAARRRPAVARIRLAPQADIGAGFVAKQVCSCIFVGGRDEQACRLDLGPELEPVRSERLADGVHAWVPLLASRSARFREGTGCTLE